jgi:hypothetical protein
VIFEFPQIWQNKYLLFPENPEHKLPHPPARHICAMHPQKSIPVFEAHDLPAIPLGRSASSCITFIGNRLWWFCGFLHHGT